MMKTQYDIIPISGFKIAALHSGVKRKKKDLGIVISDVPATLAGVFTQNVAKAAPVLLSQSHLDQAHSNGKKGVRALLVNSGNANACTGQQGVVDAQEMVAHAAKVFGIDATDIMLASTGIIGVPLEMQKICSGISKLPQSISSDFLPFGQSMMTTDTYLKVASLKVPVGDKEISLLGLAKGSGMIHPNMATMLGFIFTDAPVEAQFLQGVLNHATDHSFNMISVDGDTSTNDMVVIMANGKVDMPVIDGHSEYVQIFSLAISSICQSLAIQIAKDGEGATKMLEVTVSGAASMAHAKKAAKAVVSSSLVKAAFFGQDANWGRIACALGYSEAVFSQQHLCIKLKSRLGQVELLELGNPVAFDEQHAFDILRGDVIEVGIDLGAGSNSATAWGCDLSYDYVKINGAYRT